MKRHYFQPKTELKSIVKTIEILDLSALDTARIGNRFLPDGFFEIGFNLGSDHLQISSTSSSVAQLDNPVGYFYGQGSVSAQLTSKGRLYIMIVKIYPWAAHLLFSFDLADCIDQNLKLGQVFGKEGQFLEDRILEARCHEKQVEMLQELLIAKLRQINGTTNDLLTRATTLLFATHGQIKMKELASQAHSSPRSIQRTFRQHYGITPKQFSNQLRIRNFASQLSRHRNLSMTELALRCGYFDQAHFNHEFKSITKVTPSDFFLSEIPLVDDFLKSN